MSIRAWGYVAALGLTLATSGRAQEPINPPESPINAEDGGPQGAQNGENAPTEEQGDPVDLTPALQGIESAIRQLVPEVDEEQQRTQDSRERRDLAAQEAMADWAKWMTYATGATVVLTFIGLIALLRTLHHTRRAADYTGSMLDEAKNATLAAAAAADAARKANSLTSRQFKASFKPWISVSVGGSYLGPEDFPVAIAPLEGNETLRPVTVYAAITVHNIGAIPVHIEKVSIGLCKKRGSETFELGDMPGRKDDTSIFIDPGGMAEINGESEPIGGAIITEANRIEFRGSPPYIAGRIVYSNPTGFRYEHVFAFHPVKAWLKSWERYGGREHNYEKEID